MISMTALDHGAGHGTAAEGRAERIELDRSRDVIRNEHRRNRKACTEGLRSRDDVRRDAVHVRRKRIAGAAETALHFIEYEHRAVFAATQAQRLEEFAGHVERARNALDRFDDDRSGLVVDHRVEFAHVPGLDERHTEGLGRENHTTSCPHPR